MIKVTIEDTEANHKKVFEYPKYPVVTDGMHRMDFMIEASRMIGEFLQELKPKKKGGKP